MVVPVPVVLQKSRSDPHGPVVFKHIDQLSRPAPGRVLGSRIRVMPPTDLPKMRPMPAGAVRLPPRASEKSTERIWAASPSRPKFFRRRYRVAGARPGLDCWLRIQQLQRLRRGADAGPYIRDQMGFCRQGRCQGPRRPSTAWWCLSPLRPLSITAELPCGAWDCSAPSPNKTSSVCILGRGRWVARLRGITVTASAGVADKFAGYRRFFTPSAMRLCTAPTISR
jgi:hypothetical protein